MRIFRIFNNHAMHYCGHYLPWYTSRMTDLANGPAVQSYLPESEKLALDFEMSTLVRTYAPLCTMLPMTNPLFFRSLPDVEDHVTSSRWPPWYSHVNVTRSPSNAITRSVFGKIFNFPTKSINKTLNHSVQIQVHVINWHLALYASLC